MMADLKPCPACGGAAFVMHMYDTYDRADYGWDAGCARAKLDDGIHPDVSKVLVKGLGSKQAAIEAWNRRADFERLMKEADNGGTDQ